MSGWVAAITAVTVAAAALAGWVLRWAWLIATRTTRFLDDYFGEAERPGMPARPGVMARLSRIEEQVHANGGGSMRDSVDRIEASLSQSLGTVCRNFVPISTEEKP